jgi:electron-transferring-flavoprotein dehydrogenase
MVAAETIHAALTGDDPGTRELEEYPRRLRETWLWEELRRVCNIRPAFRWGLWGGMAYGGIDTYVLRGRAPWTLHHHADHACTKKASECPAIVYPKPDGEITFDKPSSVYLANTVHDEDQPIHLRLKDPDVPIRVNLADYDAPEERFCPAGVYEIVDDADGKHLQINAQNCVHCKTCDIKDTTQNIDWVTPEGGSGPNYPNM